MYRMRYKKIIFMKDKFVPLSYLRLLKEECENWECSYPDLHTGIKKALVGAYIQTVLHYNYECISEADKEDALPTLLVMALQGKIKNNKIGNQAVENALNYFEKKISADWEEEMEWQINLKERERLEEYEK